MLQPIPSVWKTQNHCVSQHDKTFINQINNSCNNSTVNQDLKSQDEQQNEASNRSTRCFMPPCPRFGWGRWGFATPNESSADEERQKRDENNFWYRAGMRTKLFFKNRFRG